MKKLLALVLAIVLAMGLLAGCGGSKDSASTTETKAPATTQGDAQKDEKPAEQPKEIETIRVLFREFGTMTDMDAVAAAVNEHTGETIGVHVEMVLFDTASYSQQLSLALSSGEDYDLVWLNAGEFNKYRNTGALQALNASLEAYGQDILSLYSAEELAVNANSSGEIMAIHSFCEQGNSAAFYVRKDLADKYGIDISKIKTLEDCTAALEVIHANEPELYTIVPYVATYGVMQSYLDVLNDKLTSYGVVTMNDDENLEATYLYETEEFKAIVELAREWYEAGYIPKDVGTLTERGTEIMAAGKAASFISMYHPATLDQNSSAAGTELVCAILGDTSYKTTSYFTGGMAVPASSKKVDAAVKFLNTMFSDPYIVDLMCYGIEGTHYVVNENGLYTYPEGVDVKTTTYHMSIQSAWGNELISGIWEGINPELWNNITEYNKTLELSRTLGFVPNLEELKTETSSLANVNAEYLKPLLNGELDPVTGIKDFNDKLHASGIEDVFAEVQKQLEAFKAQ